MMVLLHRQAEQHKVTRLREARNFDSAASGAALRVASPGPPVGQVWEISSINLTFQGWSAPSWIYSGAIVRGPDTLATFQDPNADAATLSQVDRYIPVQLVQSVTLLPGESIGFSYGATGSARSRMEINGLRIAEVFTPFT